MALSIQTWPSKLEMQRDVMADIGFAVVAAQVAETIMKHTLLVVLPKTSPNTLESFLLGEAELEKKMLGGLLSKLRSRVDLDDKFDELLTTFVADRNSLVHSHARIPGFDWTSPEGCAHCRRWLARFCGNAKEITRIFAGLCIAWQRQVGMESPMDPQVWEFVGVDDVEELANTYFFAKT